MTSLYARVRAHGTLTETAEEIPDAVFALPSTLNCMRAKAILVTDRSSKYSTARTFYQRVQRKDLTEPQLNSVFEQLGMTFGEPPGFEAVLESIASLEARLNENSAGESGAGR